MSQVHTMSAFTASALICALLIGVCRSSSVLRILCFRNLSMTSGNSMGVVRPIAIAVAQLVNIH